MPHLRHYQGQERSVRFLAFVNLKREYLTMTSGIAILYLYLIGIIVCTIGFGVLVVSLPEIFIKDKDAVLSFIVIITWPVWWFIALFIVVVSFFSMDWWKSKKKPSNDKNGV